MRRWRHDANLSEIANYSAAMKMHKNKALNTEEQKRQGKAIFTLFS